ncbi:MAG TPA: hypothetical protein VF752_04835 [Thermoleophilaceae bacterium]
MADVASPAARARTGPDDQGAGEKAKETAQQAAGQAQEKAQEVAGQARGRVREQVDQRSSQVGRQLSQSAQDARSIGEQLRRQGKDGPARLADQAANRAERVGGYLENSDGDKLLRDVEDFGRRQPVAVVLGGLVIGFAASRFLKASSEDRYRSTSVDRYPSTPRPSTGRESFGGTVPPSPALGETGLPRTS